MDPQTLENKKPCSDLTTWEINYWLLIIIDNVLMTVFWYLVTPRIIGNELELTGHYLMKGIFVFQM